MESDKWEGALCVRVCSCACVFVCVCVGVKGQPLRTALNTISLSLQKSFPRVASLENSELKVSKSN